MDDANRRNIQGKKFKPRKKQPKELNETATKSDKPILPMKAGNSSAELLIKRFENDLNEILEQFEIEPASRISEVTVINIMVNLGFVEESSNSDLEVVQSIWQHLEREEFAEP